MDPKSDKPLPLLINPFTFWTAMWASAHAAVRASSAPKVAVIPTPDAPAPRQPKAAKPAKHAGGAKARAKARPKATARGRKR
jgi:hypothetical protein